MLTEDIFNNMNLLCVYDNNKINEDIYNLKPFIIYVIKNEDKYYIGLTINIINRIEQHKKTDTNGLYHNGKIYILEEFDDKSYLDLFEKIWIRWFVRYGICVNKCKYKLIAPMLLHPQYDNRKNANSNYYKFQKNKIITGSSCYNYDRVFTAS
jgi:hypothetical protein